MSSQSIAKQIVNIQQRINLAIADYHQSSTVHLVAVSKTKPIEMIEAAYQAGQRHFGENYVQEGIDKIAQLAYLKEAVWHFIGDLQSNKTRDVAEHFDWMQSLSRTRIAKRLNDQRPEHLAPLQVLIQLNLDDQDSKAGIDACQLDELAAFIHQLPRLQLRGLMLIPDPERTQAQREATLEQAHQLFISLQQQYPHVDTLSMGMSQDLEQAIAHGSTMVRVGTDIFGARSYGSVQNTNTKDHK